MKQYVSIEQFRKKKKMQRQYYDKIQRYKELKVTRDY